MSPAVHDRISGVTAVVEHSATELSALVAAREPSCVEVVTAHLEQIERLDPHVDAVPIRRAPELVLTEARERDGRGRAGRCTGCRWR